MAKAAVTRSIRDDHQKNFLKIFNSLTGKHSRWEIWEDFVTLTAIEISNSTDKVNAPERTKMYQTIVSKYSAKEREGMAEMLAEVVMGMEQNPDQDFLGSLYMMCELGNDHAGQFFTPYDVCRCMAEITFDPKLHPDMEGFISVSDPACGAGATLLAFLNVCKRRNICYHNKVLVIAQDIDFIVGLMCYIPPSQVAVFRSSASIRRTTCARPFSRPARWLHPTTTARGSASRTWSAKSGQKGSIPMLVEILCGGYGCRTKTGIHTVMRGEQCEVSESEARRLIGLGVAKSPYITDRGTASTLAAAPATAEGNDTPTAETQQGGSGTAHLDPNQLQDMTVAELKKLAADMGIETKQLKTKDELVEAICAEDVVPGDESTETPELSAAMPTA